jgi:type IV pilus assembly protein PilB
VEHGRDKSGTTSPPFEGAPPAQSTPPPPPAGGDAPTWRPPPAPDRPREPGIHEGVPAGLPEETDADSPFEDVARSEPDSYEVEPAEQAPFGAETEEEPPAYEIGADTEASAPEPAYDSGADREPGPPEPAHEIGGDPEPSVPEPAYEIGEDPVSSATEAGYEITGDTDPPEPAYEIGDDHVEPPADYAEPTADYAPPEEELAGPVQSNGSNGSQPNGSQPSGTLGLTPPSRRGGSGRFITDHIVELGFATAEQVEEAIERGRTTGVPPEQALLDAKVINPDQLARATAERFGLDHLDLSAFEIDLGAVNLIPLHAAKRFEAVPVAFVDPGTVLVAMTDPTNVRAVDDIGIMTSMDVRPAVAAPEDIASVMARISKLDTAVADAIEEGEDEYEETPVVQEGEAPADAPVVKLVNGIIAQGVEEGASDIHFEPQGREIRVRYRVDGMLHDVTTIPRRMVAGVTSRLKIMGNLDIAEKRLPQDGRISVTVENHPIDIRVASLPAVMGEKIVLRLLDKDKSLITLDQLGMQPSALEAFSKSFRRAYGATLVTGPTGSGKTTSLYAALNLINTPEKNIITIEDPAEYQIRGITQVQVNVRTGLTFAAGLRSIVRADPDVIMIGEIRDRETAQIAVESALTGHLVLSTLHTNDAPSAMTRLTEMGIEPFLTASAIDCIVSQRLARLLCSSCKEPVTLTVDQLRQSDFDVDQDIEGFEARGCPRCSNSGYKGRIGLYEAMLVTDEIRTLVIERAPADAIRSVAVDQGMLQLAGDGLQKVRSGHTTIEEIARVTGSAISAD